MMQTIHKILVKYPIQELATIGLSDFRLCLSYLLRSPTVPHLPSRMIIDPINKCNLQCPFCYTGAREPGATKGEMSYECFEHIIGLNPRVNSIDLYNWGEPLLNRNIFRMLDLCRCKKIITSVHTNLSAFNTEVVESLIQSPPSRLHLSIDGISQKTYEKYRVGGNFNRVKNNMEYLSRRLRETKVPMRIEWQFLQHKYNKDDIQEAKTIAKRLGFIFNLRTLLVPKSQAETWHGQIKDRKTSYLTTIRVPCPHLWLRMSVNAGGHLTFCCSAYHDEDQLNPSLLALSKPKELLELWNSSVLQRARACFKRHASFKDIEKPILCEICGYFKRYGGLDPKKYPIIEDHISTARRTIIEGKNKEKGSC